MDNTLKFDAVEIPAVPLTEKLIVDRFALLSIKIQSTVDERFKVKVCKAEFVWILTLELLFRDEDTLVVLLLELDQVNTEFDKSTDTVVVTVLEINHHLDNTPGLPSEKLAVNAVLA